MATLLKNSRRLKLYNPVRYTLENMLALKDIRRLIIQELFELLLDKIRGWICIVAHCHTWKKPMSPPVVHFVVSVAAPIFWPFLRIFARRRLKNWISVGDRITGLFSCVLTVFLYTPRTQPRIDCTDFYMEAVCIIFLEQEKLSMSNFKDPIIYL